jgi:plastocyanin
MRKSSLAAIIIVIILIAAGALALTHKSNTNNSSANNTPSNPSNNSASSNASNQSSAGAINISNMMFTPSQITVAKGGAVTWMNNDSTTHTVTDDLSNAGGPASGDIAPGQSYSFTFNKAGSFQYHCSIHPSMRGTIVVK